MPSKTPTSCADLDLTAVELELIRTGVNVSAAAKALGVPWRDLRTMTRAVPRLMEAALEAEECALDEAEARLREVLRSDDMHKKIRVAGFILRMTSAGHRRCWGRRGTPCREPAEPQTVTLKWIDR